MVFGNSKKSSLKYDLILSVVSLAICLCSAEYVIRKFGLAPEVIRQSSNLRFVDNPKMVYEYLPGSEVGTVRVNKQGYNDTDFVLEKPKGLIRIAMLGDSLTKGEGVPAKQTFSDKLEDLLNKRERDRGSPKRYEVMNFGVGGYNLEAEVETLKEKALVYDPDIVILNMFWNDNELIPGVDLLFISNPTRLTEAQQISLARKYVSHRNSFIRWIERNVLYRSKLYLFMVTRISSLLRSTHPIMADNIPSQPLEDKGMENIYRGFQKIGHLKDQYGFKFLICIHPNLLYSESPNDLKFADIARSFHYDYFHMVSYYRARGIPAGSLQLANDPKDRCHPNAFGHGLIAEAMLVELEKHDLLS